MIALGETTIGSVDILVNNAGIQFVSPIEDFPIEKWDERLTTKSAHDVLIEAGTSRRRRKEVVDKLAAQIMLQNYLDAHTPPENNWP